MAKMAFIMDKRILCCSEKALISVMESTDKPTYECFLGPNSNAFACGHLFTLELDCDNNSTGFKDSLGMAMKSRAKTVERDVYVG